MAPQKQSRKITIAGTGNVGSQILSAVLAQGIHEVSVITRTESKSTFPEGVHKVHRGSYDDEAFLVAALQGQDVLVTPISWAAVDTQVALFKAAAKAGVPYVLPAEFGSDQDNEKLRSQLGALLGPKDKYRALVEELGVSAWIGIITNPWIDFLVPMFWPGNFKERTAVLYGEGDTKANFSTRADVGKGVAALLSLPEAELAQYKNKYVHLSSFHVTQREVLESAMRATGTKEADWTIEKVDLEEQLKTASEEARKGNMMAAVTELIGNTFRPGYGGDYQHKVVDYDHLGVQTEKLDDVMKRVLA